MIALQVPVASAMVLWAAWQLRPASRALHDGEGPTPLRWLWYISRRRPRPRQPVGDDPVLWNELHSQGALEPGRADRGRAGEPGRDRGAGPGDLLVRAPCLRRAGRAWLRRDARGIPHAGGEPVGSRAHRQAAHSGRRRGSRTGASRVQHRPPAILGVPRHALRRDGFRHRGHERDPRVRTRHLARLDRDVTDRLGDPSGQDARGDLESPWGRP